MPYTISGDTVLGRMCCRILHRSLAPNERAALNALYLRVLSRSPTPKEAEICRHYLATVGDLREGFEDIYWSLINTTEFVTRR